MTTDPKTASLYLRLMDRAQWGMSPHPQTVDRALMFEAAKEIERLLQLVSSAEHQGAQYDR